MEATQMPVLAADNSEFITAGGELLDWLSWAAIAAAVVALIVCAILMILGRRHHNYYAQNGFTGIAWVTLGLVIIAVSTNVVNQTMVGVEENWAGDDPNGGLPSWEEVLQQILDWITGLVPGGDEPPPSDPPPSTPPPTTPPETQDPRLLWLGEPAEGGTEITVLFPDGTGPAA